MSNSERNVDLATLILRVVTGAWFVTHGLIKLFVFTPAGTAGYFQSLGLPGVLGYLTMMAEILGGLALLAGFATRWVSLAMAAVLLGATVFAHLANGFSFSNPGGGWEYTVLWAAVMVALALLGGDRWSVTKRG